MSHCYVRGGALLLLCLLTGACARPRLIPLPKGTHYQEEVLRNPRALRAHVVTVDLTEREASLAVAVAPDGDGEGPGESTLTDPTELAGSRSLLVAVNANAFAPVPVDGDMPRRWYEGQPVDVHGQAVALSRRYSPAQEHRLGFYLDRLWRPAIGEPPAEQKCWEACAGFNWLIRDGEPIGGEGELHPRTAVGIDRGRTRLWMVVVDGRQVGYSEGMSTGELARFMLGLGCHDAVNLDGGGSSVLVHRRTDGSYQVLNRPSTRRDGKSITRPIPVMLGLRLPPE